MTRSMYGFTVRSFILISFALATSFARAAEPEPLPDDCDAEVCAVPLKRGERAPFDGQLLTPQLAIKLGQRAESCDARLKIEVEHSKALGALDLELERRLRQIDADAAKQREAALVRAAEEERQPWWERPPIVAAATVVLTVAALLASAQLVQAAGQ